MIDVKKIKNVKPVGSQVLVELLTEQEMMGTKLTLTGKTHNGCPQGYVLAVGPGMKNLADWGFNIGDRCIVTGSFNPLPEVPNITTPGRSLALFEPHCIKAVLEQ
jgi:co-chaperonin GroES (HSP10)